MPDTKTYDEHTNMGEPSVFKKTIIPEVNDDERKGKKQEVYEF